MRKKWSYVNVIHFGDGTDPTSVHNIAKMLFYPSFDPRVYSRQMVRQASWHLGNLSIICRDKAGFEPKQILVGAVSIASIS